MQIHKYAPIACILFTLMLVLSSCTTPPTSAAPTTALPTQPLTIEPTFTPLPLPSETPTLPPTETPLPTDTAVPIATFTPLPTATPIPSPTPLPELPAETENLLWSIAISHPGDEYATQVISTKDGGFILLANTSNLQAWVIKLRADGVVLWQKSFEAMIAQNILETSSGEYLLAADYYLLKLDQAGNVLWTKGSTDFENYHNGPITQLREEADGGFIVEATYSQAKLRADGTVEWKKSYNLNFDSTPYTIEASSRVEDNVWLSGFLPNQTWVGKTDLNGGWLKLSSFPENPAETPLFLQPVSDGGALAGHPIYSYLADGGFDLLLSRFAGDGTVRWQKVYRSAFMLFDFQAFEIQSGDFIVAGTLTHFPDTEARNDLWVLRLDANGNVRWMALFGTEGIDAVNFINEMPNGDLIFAGHTDGVGTGTQDLWVLKINAGGEIPNCGLTLTISDIIKNTAPASINPQEEMINLEAISVFQVEEIPVFEDEKTAFDLQTQIIPLCPVSP